MVKTELQAADLFRAGRLADALAAATAEVKKAPTDLGRRVLLAELLLFSGNLERADVILDAAGQLDPSVAVVVSEFRQLLRAETARRQLYRDGRVPELLGDLEPSGQASMKALVALREGNLAEAAEAAAQAEELRSRISGTANGQPFDDFRDADDLFPGYIETLTTTGKYFWIPVSRIESMEFHPPKRPRDLAWRRCSMSVKAGPDGDVYIPAIYFADDEVDEAHRLGRATSWSEGEGPVRGIGQRVFLAGEEDLSIMQLKDVTFQFKE
ncbi:type VI secretion system accessory protein TagJ [Acidocella sp.]|uniref:type VI secretion system accessory protein TagJ n=1 Tax=Acidocella sp. TaxID=50710 RepID=UPI002604A858|nr:type VI secretion system accessory protein TagJ [Acidocella sp.]